MKYFNLTKTIALVAIIAGMFASCEKVDKVDAIGDRGPTLVKIIGGGPDTVPATKLKSIDFVPTSQSFVAVDLRRDCANQADLNKTMTVVLRDDTNALNIINDELIAAGLTPFNYLDDSMYDLDPDLTKTGGKGGYYTLTMAPGEFAKEISLVVPDATVLDPTAKYALPFTIEDVDADGVISASRTMVIILGAKNKYDGVYEVTGTYSDVSPAGANFSAAYPLEYFLITTGPNSVIVTQEWDAGVYYPFYLFLNNGSASFYGSFGIQVAFDPVTDEISDLHNYYGDPSNPATAIGNPALGSGAPDFASANTRRAVLDANGTYGYDAVNKVVNVKYYMYQPSVVATGPRATFDEIWTYTGPRP